MRDLSAMDHETIGAGKMIDPTSPMDTIDVDAMRPLTAAELEIVCGGLPADLIVLWWMNSCTLGTSYAPQCP